MKTLRLHGIDGTFVLDNWDIGDYIEAEYGRLVGVVETGQSNGCTYNRLGHVLTLSCCARLMEPEAVLFKTSARHSVGLFGDRQPGDKLRMRPVELTYRGNTWYELAVNGESLGLFGRQSKR